jgi:hypothetical protein
MAVPQQGVGLEFQFILSYSWRSIFHFWPVILYLPYLIFGKLSDGILPNLEGYYSEIFAMNKNLALLRRQTHAKNDSG